MFLSVKKVENPLRACHPGLERVVHAGDLGEWLVELAHVLGERLNAAESDLPRCHLQSADHRYGDVAEVADEHRER